MVVTTWGSYETWAERVAEIVIDKAMKASRGEKLIEAIRDSLVWYEKIPGRMELAGVLAKTAGLLYYLSPKGVLYVEHQSPVWQ